MVLITQTRALLDTILRDRTPAALVTAIEANTAAFLVALGRAGDAEERADATIHWVIGGSPLDYHNCVVRAQLAPAAADAAIQEMLARCRHHRVPGSWHVGPSMRPTDLGTRLLAHGFTADGAEPGMAIDLHALDDRLPPPALTIRRVRDTHDLATWTATLADGFGEGEREARWVGAMYGRIGLAADRTWRHYVGWIDDTAVATATLLCAAGVAGIYFVFTRAPWRGQGIGAAITLAALRDGRDLGYRSGVLGASEMGYAVYHRLGFEEYCKLHQYTWDDRISDGDAERTGNAA